MLTRLPRRCRLSGLSTFSCISVHSPPESAKTLTSPFQSSTIETRNSAGDSMHHNSSMSDRRQSTWALSRPTQMASTVRGRWRDRLRTEDEPPGDARLGLPTRLSARSLGRPEGSGVSTIWERGDRWGTTRRLGIRTLPKVFRLSVEKPPEPKARRLKLITLNSLAGGERLLSAPLRGADCSSARITINADHSQWLCLVHSRACAGTGARPSKLQKWPKSDSRRGRGRTSPSARGVRPP